MVLDSAVYLGQEVHDEATMELLAWSVAGEGEMCMMRVRIAISYGAAP